MSQQETHPTTEVSTTAERPTTAEPTAPQWYGDPRPWHDPTQGHEPFGPTPTQQPSGGGPAGHDGAVDPRSFGTESGDGGWGGPGGPATAPPHAPAPAPRGRPGRRIAELSAVAVLAAALASGGTFAATRYGSVTVTPQPSVSSSQNPAAPVVQGSASNPDWSATAKAVAPSVVSITVTSRQAQGQGSGVVIDKSGHILTNNHVATGAGTGAAISVTLNDGRTYDAKIVGTDPTTDLAVLALANPPSDLAPISVGDSAKLAVGQPVMAVGNPLGLAGTVTTGIVSALNRPVTTSAAESQGQTAGSSSNPVVTNAIQTSAAINPGNSGGALVTADGQLIGINSSIASLGGSQGGQGAQSGNIGIGFAIPVNEAKSIADQLIATGTAQHAFLGVTSSDTTVTMNGSKRGAALVHAVTDGTPAAAAGLKADDAVLVIDGQPIDSSEALVATVHEHKVGDAVTMTVLRAGARTDLRITLAARPGQG